MPTDAGFTVYEIQPNRINDHGDVFTHIVGATADGRFIARPYMYQNGVMKKMEVPADIGESYAALMNNNGDAISLEYKTFDAPITNRLFKGTKSVGVFREDTAIYPTSINDAGIWAGGFPKTSTNFEEGRHAGIYVNGQRIDLGTLGGQYSNAYDINNRGQVIGTASDANRYRRGFIWENGVMRELTHPKVQEIGPTSISDTGWIAGFAKTLQRDDIMVTMRGDEVYQYPAEEGYLTWIRSINNSGVGVSMLLKNGTPQLLGALIFERGRREFLGEISDAKAKGWSILQSAADINNSGVICGFGLKGGKLRGFIATPVPEPASWLALGIGALVVGLRRSRKYQG